MLIFKWEPQLELGIDLIDNQHKKIMNEANTFFISYKCGYTKAKLQQYLSFLEQYVQYHFQAEEAFQVQCGYPNYLQHQAKHVALRMQVKFHSTTLVATSFSQSAVDDFHAFMREWVIDHILSEDIKFATYYRANPPTLSQDANV